MAAAVLITLMAACGGDDKGAPDDPDNLLTNGNFEDGSEGWSTRDDTATASSEVVRTGSGSLLVSFAMDAESPVNGAALAFQELGLEEVPEFLSFDYRIDDWIRGTDLQYVEAVVIVEGSGVGMPQCPAGGDPCPNIQMRYVLAGVISEPTTIVNARWRFVGEQEPEAGEWLHFEADLRNDMTEAWGSLPSVVTSVKLQLEVRYEGRVPDELDGAANVYWDNVYLGAR